MNGKDALKAYADAAMALRHEAYSDKYRGDKAISERLNWVADQLVNTGVGTASLVHYITGEELRIRGELLAEARAAHAKMQPAIRYLKKVADSPEGTDEDLCNAALAVIHDYGVSKEAIDVLAVNR